MRATLFFIAFGGSILSPIMAMISGYGIEISLSFAPVVHVLTKMAEYITRNSYSSTTIEEDRVEKALEDENELKNGDDVEYEIEKPFSSGRGPNARPEAQDLETPHGQLVLNLEDMENEIDEEWRIKNVFRGTSLEQLPLRATQLLKRDGWTEATIMSTWPSGATKELITSLAEAGVRIVFSSVDNEVTIKRELPHWWKQFPLDLRSKMISLGWDYDRIAYLRPCRIPAQLLKLAEQYGYK